MRAIVFLLMMTGLAWANPLKDQLIRELSETGQTNFTDLEIALIASGVAEPDALQAYIEKYKALTERLKLNDKQLKLNPKKKARTIYKLVFSNLKREDPSISGILSILDNGSYSPLSATWLYVAASQDAGLDPSAYSTMKERLDPYFLDGNPTSLKDIAASFLTVQAAVADENHLKEAGQSLKLSTLLSPQSTHGKGFSDVTLYNMALKQFNANAFVPAAWLALGATQRYPDVKEFQGLCYNIGIKIFQGTLTEGNWEEAIELGNLLAPHTGKYQEGFRKTLGTVYFNNAVNLYNAGNYKAALASLEHASPQQDGYTDLVTGSLSRLIETAVGEGDSETIDTLLPRLEEIDPERANNVKTRLSQLKLQDLDAAGQLEEALELAAGDLGSELGRNNYLSVLTRYSQSKRQESLDAALTLLDGVPAVLKEQEALKTLRFNAYATWLNKYEDKQYDQVIPIFKRLFSDTKVSLTAEDKKVFRESYGNALYIEIQKLIEDRHFHKADEKSREALDLVKGHKALLDQRKLVDTILKRISE